MKKQLIFFILLVLFLSSCSKSQVKTNEIDNTIKVLPSADNSKSLVSKEYTWSEVVEFVNSGEVEQVFQSHALDVELQFKDGSKIYTKEPKIDEIFRVIEECGKKCEDVIMSTE